METLFTVLLTSVASVFSGVVLFLIQSHLKKQRKKEEEREAEKANQMTLIIRTLNSLRHDTHTTFISRSQSLKPFFRTFARKYLDL